VSRWTLTELAELTADALAAGGTGQANGRVRERPDPRTIRWYTTLGLVGRPSGMRGKIALYDRRHLLQLVAIKRLQAEGLTLAEIQRKLVAASTRTLEEVAQLPDGLADPLPPAGGVPVRVRFWSDLPEVAAVPPVPAPGAVIGPVSGIRLDTGVVLMLDGAPRQVNDAEAGALAEAARPLLTALHELGLHPYRTGGSEDERRD
jgi:DNA-binding transcriptional MerR regulator